MGEATLVSIEVKIAEMKKIVLYIQKQVSMSNKNVKKIIKILMLDIIEEERSIEKITGKYCLNKIREWGQVYFRDELEQLKKLTAEISQRTEKKDLICQVRNVINDM